jgi:hypothetical protein
MSGPRADVTTIEGYRLAPYHRRTCMQHGAKQQLAQALIGLHRDVLARLMAHQFPAPMRAGPPECPAKHEEVKS